MSRRNTFHIVSITVLVLLVVGGLLFAHGAVSAKTDWDKSSLSVDGQCASGGITVTVTNNGSAMAGTSTYSLKFNGAAQPGGTIPALGAGASTTFTFTLGNGTYEFLAYQRPGHPGIGYAAFRVTCGSGTVTATSTATSTATEPCEEDCGTVTATTTATGTATATATTPATETGTATATSPATETATVTKTEPATSTATATDPATKTATPPVTKPVTVTITPPTATEPGHYVEPWTGLCAWQISVNTPYWFETTQGWVYGDKPWGVGPNAWFGGKLSDILKAEQGGLGYILVTEKERYPFTISRNTDGTANCAGGKASDPKPTTCSLTWGAGYQPASRVIVINKDCDPNFKIVRETDGAILFDKDLPIGKTYIPVKSGSGWVRVYHEGVYQRFYVNAGTGPVTLAQ